MTNKLERVVKDLGILTAWTVGLTIYLFSALAAAVYSFNHWLIDKNNSYWYCVGASSTNKNPSCDPLWYQGHGMHWGFFVVVIGELIFTILAANIIWNDKWHWR